MPEQLTRHPEITLQVLRSGAAQCASGAAQEILKTCPAERFCKLPGGEICIYGLDDAARMTQLGARDWQALAGASTPGKVDAPGAPGVPGLLLGGLGLVLAGMAIGWWLRRRR